MQAGKGPVKAAIATLVGYVAVEFVILGPLVLWNDGSEVPIGAPEQRAPPALLLLR